MHAPRNLESVIPKMLVRMILCGP